MLARQSALCVAPGGSAPLFPFVARHGLGVARSGRESRLGGRTGKPGWCDRRLNHGVPLRVEGHRVHRCPVPGRTAPSPWRVLTCPLIDFVARGEQGAILAGVTLRRGHVADGAVTMLFVVPMDEAHGPFSRGLEIGEALDRELRLEADDLAAVDVEDHVEMEPPS